MDEEKKGVSRRKFLKGAAVGAAGVAAMGGLVGCASDGNDSGIVLTKAQLRHIKSLYWKRA
jgi:anaerobic selenocysteine-containing dehydrogenase